MGLRRRPPGIAVSGAAPLWMAGRPPCWTARHLASRLQGAAVKRSAPGLLKERRPIPYAGLIVAETGKETV